MVTGAGQGLGEAIARRLSAEGARLALADVNPESVQAVAASLGEDSTGTEVDVRSSDAVARWAADTNDRLGAPKILVCAAGVLRDARIGNMSDADWDLVLDVSLRGTFNCIRAIAPAMSAAGYGRIITFASISARGNFGQANYAAAKAGVVGLTRTTALEMARHGVTANAISPGPIETPMLLGLPERAQAKLVSSVPVGRAGRPEEIADAALFLAQPTSGYITGVVLDVDGGYSIGASLR